MRVMPIPVRAESPTSFSDGWPDGQNIYLPISVRNDNCAAYRRSIYGANPWRLHQKYRLGWRIRL